MIKKIKKIIFLISIALFLNLSLLNYAYAQFRGSNGRILFIGLPSDVYSVEFDGSNLHKMGISTVSGANVGVWQAIYTPSGSYIIYSAPTSQKNSNLWITNSKNDQKPVQITNFTDCNATEPAANSNGTKIAFSCQSTSSSEIYILDLTITENSISASNPIKLTNNLDNNIFTSNPVWASDNSTLYVKNNTNITSISPTNTDQTNSNIIFNVNSTNFFLNDISPSGDTLLYTSSDQLFTVSTSGSNSTQITSGAKYNAGYFAPDGNMIVTQKNNSNDYQIVVMNQNGSNEKTIITSTNGIGITHLRPYWGTNQNIFESSEEENLPGPPSTGSATKIHNSNILPWILGFSALAMASIVVVYWIKVEIKNR